MPNIPYDAPYLDEAEHSALDHTGIPGVGGGGGGGSEIDWASISEPEVGITAESITLSGSGEESLVIIQSNDTNSAVVIQANGVGGAIGLNAIGASGTVNIGAIGGFFVETNGDLSLIAGGGSIVIDDTAGFTFSGTTATGVAVTAEAIHAALVALGLITA